MSRLDNILPPGIKEISAQTLAETIGATIEGDGSHIIRGVAEWHTGSADKIGFIETEKNNRQLKESGLGAAIAPMTGAFPGPAVILRVDDPKHAFSQVMRLFKPDPVEIPDIHPTAVIEPDAVIGKDVYIGPYAVIRTGAVIGDGCWIGANSYIGPGSTLDSNCRIHPHVVILQRVSIGSGTTIFSGTVIGADGFGFYHRPGDGHLKFPQSGGVVIGKNVEIQANSCVDSGSLETTTIGDGTKIDNSVQIAHNDQIGKMNIICGHTAIAGSVTTGDGVVLGGHVGVKDHATIGAGAVCAGWSIVRKDLPAGGTYGGDPARNINEWLREIAMIKKLPDVHSEIRKLRAEIRALEARLSDNQKPH